MSLFSGRAVDGSVEGGEKVSSAKGVFGGKESRFISAVGMGSGIGNNGSSVGVTVRVMLRRGLPRGFESGFFSCFSDFSCFSGIDERCFLGDNTGSVLTGSRQVSFYLNGSS